MSVSSIPVGQLWRFLKVGVLNTLFGYALYASLVAIGLQMFVAQIVGTVIAVAFNYFTYSQHVFQSAPTSRLRFVLSYGLNYLVSLAALALAAIAIPSPYLAGLLATLVTAAINFVVLRRFVFTPGPDPSGARAMPWLQQAAISE